MYTSPRLTYPPPGARDPVINDPSGPFRCDHISFDFRLTSSEIHRVIITYYHRVNQSWVCRQNTLVFITSIIHEQWQYIVLSTPVFRHQEEGTKVLETMYHFKKETFQQLAHFLDDKWQSMRIARPNGPSSASLHDIPGGPGTEHGAAQPRDPLSNEFQVLNRIIDIISKELLFT